MKEARFHLPVCTKSKRGKEVSLRNTRDYNKYHMIISEFSNLRGRVIMLVDVIRESFKEEEVFIESQRVSRVLRDGSDCR